MADTDNSTNIKKFIQTSPNLTLSNPPAALFASGGENHVDLFGALSVIAMKNPTEFIVFEPIEDRQMQGIFDSDENVDDQIEDIRLIRGKMDTEDPEKLKSRILGIFKFVNRHKYFLHGMIELEANAFGSSIFVDVDPSIINKLEAMHRKFRKEAVDNLSIQTEVTIRFIARYGVLGQIWPGQDSITGKDFVVDFNNLRGHVAGIVAQQGSIIEFIVLSETITKKDSKIDWIILRSVLQDFKEKIKYPICWFRIDMGLSAMLDMPGFDEITQDKGVNKVIEKYNNRISKIVLDFYKDEKIVGTEKQVDLEALAKLDKERAIKDMEDAIETLDNLLKE